MPLLVLPRTLACNRWNVIRAQKIDGIFHTIRLRDSAGNFYDAYAITQNTLVDMYGNSTDRMLDAVNAVLEEYGYHVRLGHHVHKPLQFNFFEKEKINYLQGEHVSEPPYVHSSVLAGHTFLLRDHSVIDSLGSRVSLDGKTVYRLYSGVSLKDAAKQLFAQLKQMRLKNFELKVGNKTYPKKLFG